MFAFCNYKSYIAIGVLALIAGLIYYILVLRADYANCRADRAIQEMANEIMRNENTAQHRKVLGAQKLAIDQYKVDNQVLTGLQQEEAPEKCEAAIAYLVDKAKQF